MIIVTGATDKLGSRIVDWPLERVPIDQVGINVRDPDRAVDLAAHGIRVRLGTSPHPGPSPMLDWQRRRVASRRPERGRGQHRAPRRFAHLTPPKRTGGLNGSHALDVAVLAPGIRPGDEVISSVWTSSPR